jgi:hypothetical protein
MSIKWLHNKTGYALKVGSITPIILASLSLSKEDAVFTEEQQKQFAKSTVDYLAGAFGFRDRISAKNGIDNSPGFLIDDFVEAKPQYLYKYVSKKSSEYYKKGRFQVGTIKYFQTMENDKARDELEGLAFIDTKLGNRIANAAVTMGSNYYVFCGTNQADDTLDDYHVENFGSVLMKIELAPFAQKMAKRLGALSFTIMKVKYANAKLIRTQMPFQMQPELFSNLRSKEMQLYLQHLISQCTLPSLFTKPGWFSHEAETRIVFKMAYDVNPVLPKQFEHKGLIKHIQFLT